VAIVHASVPIVCPVPCRIGGEPCGGAALCDLASLDHANQEDDDGDDEEDVNDSAHRVDSHSRSAGRGEVGILQ
jgi:hypothetical protein